MAPLKTSNVPLYQNGGLLRGGTGQNVSQFSIQDSKLQGEGFTVSDRAAGEPTQSNADSVGTITDTFDGFFAIGWRICRHGYNYLLPLWQSNL